MALLSVIIPVYNVEKYLSECLDSIIGQTLKDIEIICVNDGSTDNSLKILENYAKNDSRIKIVNKDNGGLASARNAGMRIATSEYITFIDSDDYIELETYEEALKYVNKADFVHFGIKVFGTANLHKRSIDNKYYKIKFNGKVRLTNKVILSSDVSACNKIYKKSIIDKNKITFPDGYYYEDAEFYCKYISCSKTVYYVKKYFYNYRRSEDSIMSSTFSGSETAIHHLYIVKHIFEYWNQNNYLKNNQKLFINLFKSFFNFAWYHSTLSQRNNVLNVAIEYAKEFDKYLNIKTNFIKNLKNENIKNILIPDLPFYKKIFNFVKFYDPVNDINSKLIYILGFKIKLSNKKELMLKRITILEQKVEELFKLLDN